MLYETVKICYHKLGDKMNITKLNPLGFCQGVTLALNKVNKAILNNKDNKPIYLLGELIHNKHIIDELKQKNVTIIKDNKEEFIKKILDGIIIMQAHGSTMNICNLLKAKKIEVIDATCPFVKIIHNNIIKYSLDNYDIIYIGKENHDETIASLSYSNNIHLVTSVLDVNNLNINNKHIYITNQTTLSKLDLKDIYKALEKKYPNAIYDNSICNATLLRQEAVINAKGYSKILVIGDKNSSNTKRLYELAKLNSDAYFINEISDLEKINFNNDDNIAITAGASTPEKDIDKVYNYLISLRF